MECSEIHTIVAGEREEDLSPAESDAFFAHVESCPACREAIARAEEDLDRLARVTDPPVVAASAWARVDAAVMREAERRPGREDPFAPGSLEEEPAATPLAVARPNVIRLAAPAPRTGWLLAFAAVAAAVVIALGFFGLLPTPQGSAKDEVVIGTVKPPEQDDVEIEGLKVGPSFKQLKKQGPLVILQGQ